MLKFMVLISLQSIRIDRSQDLINQQINSITPMIVD